MGLQRVSVQKYAWPGLCHALSMVWELALQCLLASWPRVRCCPDSPHVADKLRCLWVSTVDQWSFLTALAACECAEVFMAEVVSCFEHGLGLDLQCLPFLAPCMFVAVPHYMWL